METAAARLMARLGLSDDELCAVLDTDPLSVLTDDLAHRPEIGILLALTDAPAERMGEPMLQRWLRRRGPSGVPVEHLLARDFAAFEDALATLDERGFVLRGGD